MRTLFHEFGHGLHGLLSQVTYERLSGTHVLRDFVELPSQLFEHWALEPEVLKRHARHVDTGEPIPDALIERLHEARRFNQGFETVDTPPARWSTWRCMRSRRTTASTSRVRAARSSRGSACRARVGCATGCRTSSTCSRARATPRATTSTCGPRCSMPTASTPSSRPATRSILRWRRACLKYIYSSGNTIEPRAAYRAFRGRDAAVEPLLIKRGLIEQQPA